MPGKALRVVVQRYGRIRNCLKIQEREDGSLLLIPHRTDRGFLMDAADQDIREQHISIHPSPASAAYTVKYTNEYRDGPKYDHASRWKRGDDGFIFPVFARTPNSMEKPRYDHKQRHRKDAITSLFCEDIRAARFFYGIVAADKTFRGFSYHPMINVIPLSFRHFNVFLYSGLFGIPADEMAWTSFGSGNPFRHNEASDFAPAPMIKSFNAGQAFNQLWRMIDDLIRAHITHVGIKLASQFGEKCAAGAAHRYEFEMRQIRRDHSSAAIPYLHGMRANNYNAMGNF